MRLKVNTIFLFIFVAMLLLSLCPAGAAGSTISIIPATSNVNVGDSFSIDIKITDIANLDGWQFNLGFVPTILKANNVTEGPFLQTGGSTFFIPGGIDNALGNIGLTADSLFGTDSASGTGILATVNFTALAPGTSALTLYDVLLYDVYNNSPVPTITNGSAVVQGSAAPIPEPATFLLVGAGFGLIALGAWRRGK